MKEYISAFDLDHTLLVENSCYAFTRFLYANGIMSFKQRLYCIYMYLKFRILGSPPKKLHNDVFSVLFAGRDASLYSDHCSRFLAQHLSSLLYSPTIDRLKAAQEKQHTLFLLSSAPQFLAEPIAKALGIPHCYSSQYAIDGKGKFSHIIRHVSGSHKREILLSYAAANQVPLEHITAYSDGWDDLPLLNSVGTAVAVNPQRKLHHFAKQKGWEIL